MSILKDTVDLGHTLAEREVVIAFRSPKRSKVVTRACDARYS